MGALVRNAANLRDQEVFRNERIKVAFMNPARGVGDKCRVTGPNRQELTF
jgi:hypothetical protein